MPDTSCAAFCSRQPQCRARAAGRRRKYGCRCHRRVLVRSLSPTASPTIRRVPTILHKIPSTAPCSWHFRARLKHRDSRTTTIYRDRFDPKRSDRPPPERDFRFSRPVPSRFSRAPVRHQSSRVQSAFAPPSFATEPSANGRSCGRRELCPQSFRAPPTPFSASLSTVRLSPVSITPYNLVPSLENSITPPRRWLSIIISSSYSSFLDSATVVRTIPRTACLQTAKITNF